MHAPKGITAETMTRGTNACCVMYELHPMFAPCPSCHLLDSPLLLLTRGDPITGITPPSFARSRHFLLHRHLNELSEPERCRGTISLSLPWHPFRFRHDDKCFIICSYQHFHTYCITLEHVIRITIITFKNV